MIVFVSLFVVCVCVCVYVCLLFSYLGGCLFCFVSINVYYSAQLSMFDMEKRYRNKIIIITTSPPHHGGSMPVPC